MGFERELDFDWEEITGFDSGLGEGLDICEGMMDLIFGFDFTEGRVGVERTDSKLNSESPTLILSSKLNSSLVWETREVDRFIEMLESSSLLISPGTLARILSEFMD